MKFPVFSLHNREFGGLETGSLLTASSSGESTNFRFRSRFARILKTRRGMNSSETRKKQCSQFYRAE